MLGLLGIKNFRLNSWQSDQKLFRYKYGNQRNAGPNHVVADHRAGNRKEPVAKMSHSPPETSIPPEKTGAQTGAESNPAAGSTKTEEVTEIGGPKGPEPTRYGDWEQNGRCTDF